MGFVTGSVPGKEASYAETLVLGGSIKSEVHISAQYRLYLISKLSRFPRKTEGTNWKTI